MVSLPMMRSLLGGETASRAELRIRRPDGTTITILVNSSPVRGEMGRVTAAVVVFQDITRIKDAEQLKDDFLSLVSHELRTPLTTVQAGAAMLQRDWEHLDRDAQQALLDDIATESQRLAGLIDNMVSLANIRAGRAALETEPVLIRATIERAVRGEWLAAPGREFRIAVEPALIAAADPAWLDQVVRNVIHNGVKYSPAGTPVEVDARRVGDMIEIAVRDQGPGISEDDLPVVFDRFHRTAMAREGNTPGMGLGLYLARTVVEAHGGTIRIESPPDGGACVVFTVPLERAEG